jgi:hypothetical protein
MSDQFAAYGSGLFGSGTRQFAVTPHDTDELTNIPRAIYVAETGYVNMILMNDTVAVAIFLAAGVPHPLRPKVILDTGTSATGIIGVY